MIHNSVRSPLNEQGVVLGHMGCLEARTTSWDPTCLNPVLLGPQHSLPFTGQDVP